MSNSIAKLEAARAEAKATAVELEGAFPESGPEWVETHATLDRASRRAAAVEAECKAGGAA